MHSSFLLAFLTAPAALALPTVDSRQDYPSIHEAIIGKGKLYFGTCSDRALLEDEQNANTIGYAFGMLTPENSMKWELLEPTPGAYMWDDADFLVDWASHHNQLVRGHTLISHSQLPEWVAGITDPDLLAEVIQIHVGNVVGRYKGDIYAWDVVNEIFNDDGTLRESVFSKVLGDDFVRIAFGAARKADPAAKLYINDYNLDSASSAKTKAMVTNVDKWIAEGIPIDGIGSQTHITQGQGRGVAGALAALAATGVKEVAITELDVADAPAKDYRQVVDACVQEAKCVGVSVWGVSDKDSWRADTAPLLFDNDHQPKQPYISVIDSFLTSIFRWQD